jgi:acetoin utilization protein AcuB
MNASELLSELPITVEPTASLEEAARRMEQFRIHHLPVVRHGELVGLMSDGDLLMAATQARMSEHDGAAGRSGGDEVPRRAEQIMSTPVRTIGLGISLDHIVELLLAHKFSALPVMGDEGLQGMVTKTDLLRWYGRFCEAHPANPTARCRVRSRMRYNVVTVSPDVTAEAARERMARADVRHLPVVEANRPVGMVSDHDIRRVLGRKISEGGQERHAAYAPAANVPVGEMMTPDPVTIAPDATMARAAGLMVTHRVGALPVVDGGLLAGIITHSDALREVRSLVICAAA